MDKRKLDEPLNQQERYLHGIAIRLDALCHMVSGLVEEIAKQKDVPVESVKVTEKPQVEPRKPTPRKRTVKKEE